MAKDRSFAAKMAKSIEGTTGEHCQVCGKLYTHVKQVSSVKSGKNDSWKFSQRMVAVCDCNEKDVMG